jgi:hypothetical protein
MVSGFESFTQNFQVFELKSLPCRIYYECCPLIQKKKPTILGAVIFVIVGRANIGLYVQIMFDSSVPVYTISVILS